MPINFGKGNKRKSLLAYKDKLLQEIKYSEQRIYDNTVNKSENFDDNESSDSDIEFNLPVSGPSVLQLKKNEKMLQTCLQATGELTSLDVLQSEVNVLVQEPQIEGEPPVKEPGVWSEVTAECCVDLVPFSITFYVHKPYRKFGPLRYRGVRAAPLKSAHEAELAASVLPTLTTPSDCLEVLRSYAAAHRSRRSSLARLAERFGPALTMEPIASGGYLLKCANVLEVSWSLQNKWSPIAPFHHKMKFDLEYMEEQYLKHITAAHRQLAAPALDAAQRTRLLADIVSTALTARGMDTGLDTSAGDRSDGREVMAPPKSIPKKSKQKGKQNEINNTDTTQKSAPKDKRSSQKGVKRSVTELNDEQSGKRLKSNANGDENAPEEMEVEETGNHETALNGNMARKKFAPEKNGNNSDNKATKGKTTVSEGKKIVPDDKTSQKSVSSQNNEQKAITEKKTEKANEKSNQKTGSTVQKKQKVMPNESKGQKPKNSKEDGNKETEKATVDVKISDNNEKPAKKIVKKTIDAIKKPASNRKEDNVVKQKENKKIDAIKNTENIKKIANSKDKKFASKTDKNGPKTKGNEQRNNGFAKTGDSNEHFNGNAFKNDNNTNSTNKVTNENVKVVKTVQNVTNKKEEVVKKVVKKIPNDKNDVTKAVTEKVAKPKSVPSNIASGSQENATSTTVNSKTSVASSKNPISTKIPAKNISSITKSNIKKPLKPNENKLPKSTNIKNTNIAIKKVSGHTEKENLLNNKKISKIPQKKTSTPKGFKKMPTRISPRKPFSKPLAGSNIAATNIPRLLSKPKVSQ